MRIIHRFDATLVRGRDENDGLVVGRYLGIQGNFAYLRPLSAPCIIGGSSMRIQGIRDVMPDTLELCTGCVDFNEDLIFENDILHLSGTVFSPETEWLVKRHSDGSFWLNSMDDSRESIPIEHISSRCAILAGNIHDRGKETDDMEK